MNKKASLILSILILIIGISCNTGTSPQTSPEGERRATKIFEYQGSIGSDAVSPGALREAEDIMISGDFLYVVDTDNHRINKYDLSGNFLSALEGEFGPFQNRDPGGFIYPRSITQDGSGNIYVMDTQNERVQIFDSSGNFLRQFGEEGTGNGQFDFPFAIALDGDENIYITDTYNYRIQKFSNSGTFISSWDTVDNASIPLKTRCIEIVGTRIYVKEYRFSNDVVSYALDGSDPQFLTESFWFSDVDEYEVDDLNDQIDIYENSVLSFSISHASLDLNYVEKVERDAYGNYYLLETDLYRVRKIDVDGNVLATFGPDRDVDGEFLLPGFMDLDDSSNLYIADQKKHHVDVFDSGSNHVRAIGFYGHDPENIVYPDSVTWSPMSGNIFIRHMYGISEFTTAGAYVSKPVDDTPPYGDIEADSSGNIYYTAVDAPCVTKLASDGTVLASWGTNGYGTEQLYWPYGINFDDDGNVLIADKFNRAIKTFTPNGAFVDEWVHPDQSWIMDIARDSEGNYYILNEDVTNTDAAVMVLDSNFDYLGEFGLRGAGEGEFMSPLSIRVNADGLIFVSDVDRSDIQYYTMLDNPDRMLRSAKPLEAEIIFPDEEKLE